MAQRPILVTTALAVSLALILPPVPTAEAQGRGQRQAERQSERQNDRQADRRSDRQSERQSERRSERQSERQNDRQSERRSERQADRQSDRPAERQSDGQTEQPTERQTGRTAERPAERQPEGQTERPAEQQNERPTEQQSLGPAERQTKAAPQADRRAEAETVREARQQGLTEVEADDDSQVGQQGRRRTRAEADAEAAAVLDATARAEAQAIAARDAADANRAVRRGERQVVQAARAAARGAAQVERGTNTDGTVAVDVRTITEAEIRRASEDFETDSAGNDRTTASGQVDGDNGLSDLEEILLLGLGAAPVGAILNNGQEVVANTGDRVVTLLDNGEYEIYRDEDVLLREAGATIQTETFADGSIRSFLKREDGTQVLTIRDGSSRVLRRARILTDGTQVEIINDLEEIAPVDVINLIEQAPMPVVVSLQRLGDAELQTILREEPAYDPGRDFSLRQVRDISAVRNLVPPIDLNVNFATDSAAVPVSELSDLVGMGIMIEDALAENPSEVFLIEGHTDAVGTEAYNLALSDRRAESVALALIENFSVQPENLVIQGYGEEFLRVPTDASETENRRASLRRITPLLGEAVASLTN